MKSIMQHIAADVLDKDLLSEALALEIAERIDYEDIAARICEEYESSINDAIVGCAAELLNLLPF